jgi:hypothetical protein
MKGSHSLLLPKGVCARRLQSRSVWVGRKGGREEGRVECWSSAASMREGHIYRRKTQDKFVPGRRGGREINLTHVGEI